MTNKFGRLSNTFYRLVRQEDSCRYTVYDFHTSVNGFRWMQCHEDAFLNDMAEVVGDCYHNPIIKFYDKEKGNNKYRKLKTEGFVFAGTFEEDVCGRQRRI